MMETFLEAARSVPATLQLIYRLLRDQRVDQRKRAAVVAALAYAADAVSHEDVLLSDPEAAATG